MSQMAVTFASLSPAEVGVTTGVTPELQRVWRKRGQLASAGRTGTPYTLRDAAEIAVRHELNKKGIAAAISTAICEAAAPMIIWCMLMSVEGACEVVGPSQEVDTFSRRFYADDALIRELTGVKDNPSTVMFLADYSTSPIFNPEIDFSSFASASGIYINLEVLARRLGERLGRPVIHVALSQTQGGSKARRLLPGGGEKPSFTHVR